MSEVVNFPHRRVDAGSLLILSREPVQWALYWAANDAADRWLFAGFSMAEPAQVAARAIAARYGCKLVIEEGAPA